MERHSSHEQEPSQQYEPNYSLTNAEVDELSSRLFTEKVGESRAEHRYIVIELSGASEYANIARNIERRVFEVTFPSNNAQMLTETYKPYEESSRFFVSIDRTTKQATYDTSTNISSLGVSGL